MPRYLIAIHCPTTLTRPARTKHDIDVLNEEMMAAGVRIFVGGLRPASSAKSLRVQPNGKVLITDGPYLETKEHIDGFWCWKSLSWTRRWNGA